MMEFNNANAGYEPTLTQKHPCTSEIENWLVTNLAVLCGLERDEIDVDALITSLGLESLTLFTLAGDLANWLAHDISATLLWEYPTIRALAAYLGQGLDEESGDAQPKPQSLRSLVAIQPQGNLPPLYLVHDVTGTVWCYAALARAMGTQQPLYSFQLPEGFSIFPDPPRVEELAALYVAELRAYQPEGPYLLGGFSMGGAIAFEMARQLREQAQEVALLILMDTYFPGLQRRSPSPARIARVLLRHLRDLEKPQRVDYVRQRFQKLARSTQGQSKLLTPRERVKEELLGTEVGDQLNHTFLRYKPESYAGCITLVSARTQFRVADDCSAWCQMAQEGVERCFVPGDHNTIGAEPYVRHLAQILKKCLHSTGLTSPC